MIKNILIILTIAFIVLFASQKGSTQSYYLEGKEWWLTDPAGGGLHFACFISDYVNEVTIEYPYGSGRDTVIYTGQGVMTRLLLDGTYYHGQGNNATKDAGIHITSCKPGFLFFMNEGLGGGSADATHIIPLDKLGTHYIVTGLVENYDRNFLGPENTDFVILATEDSTNITFISRDTTSGSLPATNPDTLQLILNRGQSHRFTKSMNGLLNDFVGVTGSEVISNKPIATFASAALALCGPYDFVITQIPPYSLWGKRYITAQSVPADTFSRFCISQSSADYIEILAGPNPTIVTLQGATTNIYNLKPYQSVRHIVPPAGSISCSPLSYVDYGETNTIITADNPVMIHQLMQSAASDFDGFMGDPSVITVFPESTWQNDLLIGVPLSNEMINHYITVVIKDEGTARSSLRMDGNFIGTPSDNWLCFPTANPQSNYRYQRFSVIAGSLYAIKSDSAFMVYVTGEGNQTSYGFIGGGMSHSDDPRFLSAHADTVCFGELSSLFAEITGGTLPYKSFLWTGEDGFTSTNPNPQYVFPSGSGTYKVRLEVMDATGKYSRNKCGDPFYDFLVFVKDTADLDIGDNITICKGDRITLNPFSSIEEKTVSFKSEGGTLTIPDNNPFGVNSNINVAGVEPTTLLPGMLTAVCIEIDHPVTSDLTISLTSPSGTTIQLSSKNNPNTCCSNGYHKTCFSDSATENIANAHAPFSGFFIPEEPLSSFNAENVNGTWILNVIDDTTLLKEGELIEWSLNFSVPDSGISYSWNPSTGLSKADTLYPTAFPDQITTYYLTKTLSNGCAITDSVTIYVNPIDDPSFSYSATSYCQSEINPVPVISGGFSGIFTASPEGLAFMNNTTGEINLSACEPGSYNITFTTNGPCPRDSTVSITIIEGISLSTTVTNTICTQSNGEACVTVDGSQ